MSINSGHQWCCISIYKPALPLFETRIREPCSNDCASWLTEASVKHLNAGWTSVCPGQVGCPRIIMESQRYRSRVQDYRVNAKLGLAITEIQPSFFEPLLNDLPRQLELFQFGSTQLNVADVFIGTVWLFHRFLRVCHHVVR